MKRKHRICAAMALALVLLLLAATALASGPYELLWYAIGAGGATSEGGVYSLSASIGQNAADSMSGGVYSLGGGFWSGVPPVYLRYLPVIFR